MPQLARTLWLVVLATMALGHAQPADARVVSPRSLVALHGAARLHIHDIAQRKVCTRKMARAGLCRVRPSSTAPALRQPALPGACPSGQMRVGKRCVGPVAAPPVKPQPQPGRCLGGSWTGSGCFCPAGGVARPMGGNLYACGVPGDCVGGRRVGGVCVRP